MEMVLRNTALDKYHFLSPLALTPAKEVGGARGGGNFGIAKLRLALEKASGFFRSEPLVRFRDWFLSPSHGNEVADY